MHLSVCLSVRLSDATDEQVAIAETAQEHRAHTEAEGRILSRVLFSTMSTVVNQLVHWRSAGKPDQTHADLQNR